MIENENENGRGGNINRASWGLMWEFFDGDEDDDDDGSAMLGNGKWLDGVWV